MPSGLGRDRKVACRLPGRRPDLHALPPTLLLTLGRRHRRRCRCCRLGQTKPVTVYRLITKTTVDENIYNLSQRKLKLDAGARGGAGRGGCRCLADRAGVLLCQQRAAGFFQGTPAPGCAWAPPCPTKCCRRPLPPAPAAVLDGIVTGKGSKGEAAAERQQMGFILHSLLTGRTGEEGGDAAGGELPAGA